MGKGAVRVSLRMHRDRTLEHPLGRWRGLIPHRSHRTPGELHRAVSATRLLPPRDGFIIFLSVFLPSCFTRQTFHFGERLGRLKVKGGQRRRQELQAAVWMLYVLLRAPCQLLLPLPGDGSPLGSSQGKNTGKGIPSHLEWELEHKPGTSQLSSSDGREGSGKSVPGRGAG